ncbi:hypothetical protein BCR44DRAFT_280894 [Catenaria anguillulae PL171]|uniref:Uncharacterized protein n=1 Tax=Catenaria anguillulae PL171 TaxID=765915 RepID=A0A1Y2HN77_9FUNG|nr:hypothetical protein BCR44DRAFT_280894 [Catenaria anguillulae PL171]
MFLVISCLLTVLGGYLLVYLQLRRVAQASASAIVFPNIGKTTMMALGQSRGTLAKAAGSSSHGSKASSLQKSIEQLAFARSRSIPTISASSKTSSSHYKATVTILDTRSQNANQLDQVDETRSTAGVGTSIANLAAERSNETRVAEARVVKRAGLTFLAYSFFVFPFTYFIWLGHRYGARPTVQEDYWICATKLMSEICDPIILIILDRRFNAEFRDLIRWRRGWPRGQSS